MPPLLLRVMPWTWLTRLIAVIVSAHLCRGERTSSFDCSDSTVSQCCVSISDECQDVRIKYHRLSDWLEFYQWNDFHLFDLDALSLEGRQQLP